MHICLEINDLDDPRLPIIKIHQATTAHANALAVALHALIN
jgi:hypothetical protein